MSTLHLSRLRVELDVQSNSFAVTVLALCGEEGGRGFPTQDLARRAAGPLSAPSVVQTIRILRERCEALWVEAESRACSAAQAQTSRRNFSVVSRFIELATVSSDSL